MFETERLLLRECRPSDEPFFNTIYNTYDVHLNLTYTYVKPSAEHPRTMMDTLNKSPLFVVAESKETGEALGFLHLSINPPQNLNGEFGIAIAKKWWAKGYGMEMLKWLIAHSFKNIGLRRLSLFVFASNPGAIALYEHVGFKHEGRQREAVWKEGKWVDLLWMGLLSREHSDGIKEEIQSDGQQFVVTPPPDRVLL